MGDDALEQGGGHNRSAVTAADRPTGPAANTGTTADVGVEAPPADPPGRRPATGVPPPGRRRRRGGKRDSRAPYGWWPVVVVIAVALVDRIESSVLSAILVDLQNEWGFSDTAGGSLSAAISIMGTALALPAGYLADRANRKNLLAFVVALWSLITLGSAASISFTMFFITRLALAAADSIDNPSQVSLLADYYSVEVRPKVLGFHRMMTFAGGAIGTLYGGIVAQLWGWRAVFYIVLVPGLVVAWWCYRLHEPRRGEADARAAAASYEAARQAGRDGNGHAPPAEHEVREIAAADDGVVGQISTSSGGNGNGNGNGHGSGRGDTTSPDSEQPGPSGFDTVDLTQAPGVKALFRQIKTVLKIRSIVLVYAGLAVLFFGLAGIFFWLPTFYRRDFDLEAGTASSLTAAITLFGVVGGTWIGGIIGERVHGNVKGGRVVAGGTGIVLGAIVYPFALYSATLPAQTLLLLVAITLMSVAIPNLQSSIADALPANQRGVGFSLLGIFTTFGAFGPLLVGMISDATGSLVTAFSYLLGPMAVGGLVTIAARGSFDDDVRRAMDEVVTAAGHRRDDDGDDGGQPPEGPGAPPGPEPDPSGAAAGADEPARDAEADDGPAPTSTPGTDADDIAERLAAVRGLGPARVAALREHFGDLEALRRVDVGELTTVPGIGPALAEAIVREVRG